ncbi:MAG: hypothetical protein WC606_02135 [Candidatus Absconditabacterales bacterium]|jgi:hypothetical protein
MVFTKKVAKAPAVMVETKKMSAKDTCGIGCCCKMKHLLVFVLVILNTIMIAWILCNQTTIEANKVGGRANYKMVQQIYKSETFKAQQKQQIEAALLQYQGGATQTVTATPTATTTAQPVTQ